MPDYTKDQYNALIHAIWRIDQDLKTRTDLTDEQRDRLFRDRESLQDVFIGDFKIRVA